MKAFFRYSIAAWFFISMTAYAESEMNFAKSTQNPLAINPEARYFTVPFVNYTNFGYGTTKNTQNILDLKPITPFPLTSSYDIILRTIIPYMHQPNGNHGYLNGLGDINPTAFITPSDNRSLLWGFGPTLIMPTATNQALGAGKWSIGPELVLIAMPDAWTFAILAYNVWSVGGQSNRPSVNQLTFQYYITYNFPHGWYVTTQPTMTSNWFQPTGQKWTVPVGMGAGRAFHVGQQAMNISVQAYDNIIRPTTGPHWYLQANFELLFPDKRTG